MHLSVTDDGRYLHDGGEPFFYLADTAWMLFGKLTEAEARELFADRAAKGFTAVQAIVFRDLFEPNTPHPTLRIRPFVDDAAMRRVELNPDWIAHVDKLIGAAAEHGLVVSLLPTWGDKWNAHSNSAGPVIMDREKARAYCRTLSDKLGHHENLIWVLGGDSPVNSQAEADTIHAMANGIRAGAGAGAGGGRLVTYHPCGQESSAVFHAAPWLDFNALQSSHFRPNFPNYTHVERLRALTPPKPAIDLEANYEGIGMFLTSWHGLQPSLEVTFSAYDVRKAYYRGVLAGAAGHTYGAEPLRQVHRAGDRVHGAEGQTLATWREALAWPGSSQLRLLKDTLLARSYFTREPAQELVRPYTQLAAWPDPMNVGLPAGDNTDPAARISAARCREGGWIMAYMPVRQMLYLDVSGLRTDRLRLSVYDPETGEATDVRELDKPRRPDEQKTYATRVDDGMLLYVPARDLDTFFVIDAI